MPTVTLPPSDVFHNCFAFFEYTRRAHYKMYVYELPAELPLAFSALPNLPINQSIQINFLCHYWYLFGIPPPN